MIFRNMLALSTAFASVQHGRPLGPQERKRGAHCTLRPCSQGGQRGPQEGLVGASEEAGLWASVSSGATLLRSWRNWRVRPAPGGVARQLPAVGACGGLWRGSPGSSLQQALSRLLILTSQQP